MNKLKIVVYAISKNEEKFVNRWVNSMNEADDIYVLDTGSDDNTVSLLKSLGVNVNETKLDKWRFDSARNISLSYVPDDADICVCTDLDEVFESGWRKELEKQWIKDKTTRARYNYNWSFNDDGSPAVCFYAEKIHARKGFRWIHPVHEVLEYSGNNPESYVTLENILLNHHPDNTKPRSQYLPLLELSVEENPDDDRNVHYLGREYMYYKMWDKCIETLKRHLSLPNSVWHDERCASMRYIARAYKAKGDYYNAQVWLYRAIAEAPYLREPYTEFAILANELQDFDKAYFMVNEALKIKNKPKTYINEGFCWDSTLYDIGSVSAFILGLYKKASELIEKALSINPDDERIINNYEIITEFNS